MQVKKLFFFLFLKSLTAFILLSGFSVYAQSDWKEVVVALQEEAPAFQGDCGKDYVQILYDDLVDYEMACKGIQKAENFSEFYLDYKIEKPIRILFGDATVLYQSRLGVSRIPGVGVYDHKENIIVLQPWEIQKNQKHFGELPPKKSFFVSFVVHEVIHRIHYANFQDLLSSSNTDLKVKTWREARIPAELLSYIAQIETLSWKEREQVLSLDEAVVYLIEDDINPSTYEYEPNLFAIRVYKFWKENPDFIDRVFNVQWNVSIKELHP